MEPPTAGCVESTGLVPEALETTEGVGATPCNALGVPERAAVITKMLRAGQWLLSVGYRLSPPPENESTMPCEADDVWVDIGMPVVCAEARARPHVLDGAACGVGWLQGMVQAVVQDAVDAVG